MNDKKHIGYAWLLIPLLIALILIGCGKQISNSPAASEYPPAQTLSTIAASNSPSFSLTPTDTEIPTRLYIMGCDEDVSQVSDPDRLQQIRSSGLVGVQSISAGFGHCLAVKSDGTVWAWGWNKYGQLGDGTTSDSQIPIQVNGLTGVKSVAAGFLSSLALKTDGTVWGWGSNMCGELGCGTEMPNYSVPVVVSGLTNVEAIALGDNHALALKTDNTVWAWGDNLNKEIGNGSIIPKYRTPVQVNSLSGVKAIAASAAHSLAVKTDGTVWAWGTNSRGELGDGNNLDSNVPVQSINLSKIQTVSAGSYHCLAIKSDGTVWAWGSNSSGQLGVEQENEGISYNNIPFQITGLADIKVVSTGIYHSLALKSDGTVWAWGANGQRQVSNVQLLKIFTPIQVESFSYVKTIAAGGYCNLIIGVLKENP